jgi:putative inorganic carbon (HCO3(-)) transporter
MLSAAEKQDRALLIIAVLAASFIHVSIAVSQSLLGVGVGLMLVFRRRFDFTRIRLPLALFFVLTFISLLLSPDPWGGHAQIRKFFVFFLIPLLYGVFSRHFSKVYYVIVGWTITATASGLWGLAQFYLKYRHSEVIGEDFYTAYNGSRITGFESHWMTFSALQLSVLLLLLAQWFFSDKRMPHWAYGSILVLAAAIELAWTRGVWIAAVPSILYLFWCWKPKMIWIVPLAAVLAFAISPSGTMDRLSSVINPHGDTDSNEHRVVTFRTGIEMIKAHPWFGLGPEQVGKQFKAYVPADIPRPLPVGYYGHLHNIYIQYAAERGIAAMLVMMWLIGQMLWDCFHALRRLPPGRSQQRFLLHGAIAVTIAILIEGIFEFNLGDSEVLMMFVSVIALAYAAIRNAVPNELKP